MTLVNDGSERCGLLKGHSLSHLMLLWAVICDSGIWPSLHGSVLDNCFLKRNLQIAGCFCPPETILRQQVSKFFKISCDPDLNSAGVSQANNRILYASKKHGLLAHAVPSRIILKPIYNLSAVRLLGHFLDFFWVSPWQQARRVKWWESITIGLMTNFIKTAASTQSYFEEKLIQTTNLYRTEWKTWPDPVFLCNQWIIKK